MISLELLLLWVSLLLGAFLHPDAYCDRESVNQLASCDVLFYTILAGLRAAKNNDIEHPVAWTEKNQAPPTISWLVSACDAWAAAMSGGALGKHSAHGLCSSKDQRGGWPKLGYDPCMVRIFTPHECLIFMVNVGYIYHTWILWERDPRVFLMVSSSLFSLPNNLAISANASTTSRYSVPRHMNLLPHYVGINLNSDPWESPKCSMDFSGNISRYFMMYGWHSSIES